LFNDNNSVQERTMKRVLFTLAVVLVFGLASLAQSTTPSSQESGTQSTNPTTGSASSTNSSDQSGSQSSASGSMGQSSSSTTSKKGEKKLKGCIQSEGGQYVLQEKGGKQVQLTGSADLASHVGHQVTVHGTYEGASGAASTSSNEKMPSASGSTTANPSMSTSSGEQFMVSKIDHESDTCKIKGASSGSASSTSGTGSSGTTAPDHQ
jgi:hypothetical protein